MIKRVGFGWRRPGMTRRDFETYWSEVHASLAMNISGLRGYRLSFVDEWSTEPAGDWDGFAELWFDDEPSMLAGFARMEHELAADRERFLGDIRVCTVREMRIR